MKTLITRPAPKDSAEIHRLFAITIRQAFAREGVVDTFVIDREIKSQRATLGRDFVSDGRDEFFLIVRNYDNDSSKENNSDGRIVGTVAFGPPNEIIRNKSGLDLHDMPEVKSVYVLPEVQGRGIGSLLFAEIIAKLHERKIERFCLDSGYTHAQKFWMKKLGDPAVILKDYFGPGAHHMIWMCRVGGLV